VEDYVWRDGLLLGSQRPVEMGGRRHFHLDHLGTPRLITSDNGQRVSMHDYLPFGDELTPLTQEGPAAAGFDREEPLKFTGHERDFAGGMGGEDGHALDYMHARYCSPTLGRFLSVDPMTNAQKTRQQPQAWNHYSYVANNPIGHNDPTGKCTDTETCVWDLVRWGAPVVAEGLLRASQTVGSAFLLVTQQYAAQRLSNFQSGPKPQVVPAILSERQDKPPDTSTNDKKAGAQDKKLSGAEVDNLEEHNVDIHELKQEVTGDKKVSKYDLYKDKDGSIFVKPKNGKGPGEPTGLNINDFNKREQ
jgi:RHS repeat-associated protein